MNSDRLIGCWAANRRAKSSRSSSWATVICAGVAEDVGEAHRAQPVGVVDDLGAVRVEDAHQLVEVAPGVGDDVLGGLRRAGARPSRRVADLAGEPTDDEDRRVPEVLELAQLAQHHGVTERQVAAGRVDAELDPQRAVLAPRGQQPLGQPVRGQDLRRAGGEDLVRFLQVRRQLYVITHADQSAGPGAAADGHPACTPTPSGRRSARTARRARRRR